MACQGQGKLAEAEISYPADHSIGLRARPSLQTAWGFSWPKLAERAKRHPQCFQQALQFMADSADLHNNMAVVLSQLQQFDAAIASYRQAWRRLKPNSAEACYNLGLLLKTKGPAASKPGLNMNRPFGSGPIIPRRPMSWAARWRPRASSPRRWPIIAEPSSFAPHFAEAHSNLGVALANLGDWDARPGPPSRSGAAQPQYPNAQTNLGNALRHKAQPAEAEAHHREALRLRPDFAEAHANLGMALMDQGHLARLSQHHRPCRHGLPPDRRRARPTGPTRARHGRTGAAADGFAVSPHPRTRTRRSSRCRSCAQEPS